MGRLQCCGLVFAMDEAKQLFEQGQQILRDAAKNGDVIMAMRGRALCHRAIELRWYEHGQGNLLDPPWVARGMFWEMPTVGPACLPREGQQLTLFDVEPPPQKHSRRRATQSSNSRETA